VPKSRSIHSAYDGWTDRAISSASEVTTIWRYTNVYIIIIIIILHTALAQFHTGKNVLIRVTLSQKRCRGTLSLPSLRDVDTVS